MKTDNTIKDYIDYLGFEPNYFEKEVIVYFGNASRDGEFKYRFEMSARTARLLSDKLAEMAQEQGE